MYKKVLIPMLSLMSLIATAQTQFIQKGRIEFEKKVNQHKPFEDEKNENSWMLEYLKSLPKIVTDNYELRFSENKSVYKMIKENTDNKYSWSNKPSETDITQMDLATNTVSIQRDIFENTYLIKDSVRNLDWHISNETRDIAGFECKKAVTKICDSVVVVAFYTDQITVSSGPESFGGLPGMILGLAIPRLYTTWFATKLELIDPTTAQLNPVQKGKKVNRQQLHSEIAKALKDEPRRIWIASL
jgi:GLPGLI family protein